MTLEVRTRVLTAVTLALVFASGGVAGFALAAGEGDAAEPPPPSRRGFVYEQFNPGEEQQVQIDWILQAHRQAVGKLYAELGEIQRRYQAQTDSITFATTEAIALVFPPEVAAEYRERIAERRIERERARQDERDPRGDRR